MTATIVQLWLHAWSREFGRRQNVNRDVSDFPTPTRSHL
jgi:hypothetical protein